MKSHNQADMFVVELVSITKLDGELAPDEVILRVRNLSVDQVVFDNAVRDTFIEDKVEFLRTSIKVTLVMSAEKLGDHDRDKHDTEEFLGEIAGKILKNLTDHSSWGVSGTDPDHRSPYTLLD